MKNLTALFSPTLCIALGSVFISFSAVFVTLTTTPPTTDAFYRMLFGGLILLAVCLIKRTPFYVGPKAFFLAWATALFFALDLTFWHQSIELIGPGLSTILVNLQAFVLALVGVLYYREQVNLKFVIAMPMTLVGLYLLVGINWGSYDAHFQIGVLLSLLAMLCYCADLLTLNYARRIDQRLPILSYMAQFSLYTAFILGMIALFRGESFSFISAENVIWIVMYAVLCQVFGWSLIVYGIPKAKLSVTGFLLLLQPALSFIWDMLFFGRPTTALDIFGAILTLVAIYLVATRSV